MRMLKWICLELEGDRNLGVIVDVMNLCKNEKDLWMFKMLCLRNKMRKNYLMI